jgi:hypothetical protein
MAGDLIPPPSPAGRPEPDAPRLVELPPDPAAERVTDPGRPEPIGPSPFRNRFGFLIGALVGVVVAAAAVAAVVLTTGGESSQPGLARDWSSWRPADTDADTGAVEIAQHVAPKYRLDDGTQLVAVLGGPLQIQQIPLSVALRPQGGNIQLLDGNGILYTLNGLGPHGSIIAGKPSAQRLLLLRREALELALYSFRYLKDVDMVVTLLPPPPPKKGAEAQAVQQPTEAVFYRPGDLLPQLQVPLGVTLPAATPRPGSIPTAEARRVDSLTNSNLFQATFQQAQDARAYLVLNRPTPR